MLIIESEARQHKWVSNTTDQNRQKIVFRVKNFKSAGCKTENI